MLPTVHSSSQSENDQQRSVFISYSDKDVQDAVRLYDIFRAVGLTPWMKHKSIGIGQDKMIEIKKAVERSGYFIALLSRNIINKDEVHKEFKLALDTLDKFAEGEVYVLPVRLEDCEIPYEKLRGLQPADLFPDWNAGIERILRSVRVDEMRIKSMIEGGELLRILKAQLSGKDIITAINRAFEELNLTLKEPLPDYEVKKILISIPQPFGSILLAYYDNKDDRTTEKVNYILSKLHEYSKYDENTIENIANRLATINKLRSDINDDIRGSENEILIECLRTFLTDIDQIVIRRKIRRRSGSDKMDYFKSIKEFWLASKRNQLKEGDWVKVFGTFSEYAPLTLGIPWERKREHFNWRANLSTIELRTPLSSTELPSPTDVGIDGIMSLSSGNAIARFRPFALATSNMNRYAGLYQAIGRNSIPLILDEHLYQNFKRSNAEIGTKHTYDVELIGTLERSETIFSTFTTIAHQFDVKPISLQVDEIRYVSGTDFFEADIWGIFTSFKNNKKKTMITRCPDFAEKDSIYDANNEIKEEVRTIFGNDSVTIAQYDYETKPFGDTPEHLDRSINQAHNVIQLIRGIYKNLEELQKEMLEIRNTQI